MSNRFLFLFLLFFTISCSHNNNIGSNYCIPNTFFSIKLNNSNLSDINKKKLLNSLINNSGINIDQNDDKIIELDVNMNRRTTILSENATADTISINFLINYKIYDTSKNIVIDRGKIIITESSVVSENRFINYTNDQTLMNNFFNSLSIKLKNRLDLVLTKYYCI